LGSCLEGSHRIVVSEPQLMGLAKQIIELTILYKGHLEGLEEPISKGKIRASGMESV